MLPSSADANRLKTRRTFRGEMRPLVSPRTSARPEVGRERNTRRILIVVLAAVGLSTLAIPHALAGSPHFVDDSVQATINNTTLTVSGKEAGLGDEQQVH